MACEIKIEGGLVRVVIEGVLCLADQQAVQSAIKDIVSVSGSASILVQARDFHGWSGESGWDDMAFLAEYGDSVSKIAIVGDPLWRDDAYAFAGKGFRDTEILFFQESDLPVAERWVGGGPSNG